MKFRMAQNSIFAILLRSSWWMSAAIAIVLFAIAFAAPNPTISALFFFAALPLVVISVMAAWKQRDKPSRARVERTAATLQAMSWSEFANVLSEGFRHDGCEVARLANGQVDFELRRSYRLAVVSAKRWKASRVGVQALRELSAACEAREAHEGIYVTLGEVSEQAAAYARQNQIQFMTAPELARLLPELSKGQQ